MTWLPWWLRWQRICLQCGRPRFNPWVGKIPWRGKWQPTPVLLPGKSHGLRSLVDYSPWGRRHGHDWATSLSLSWHTHSSAWYSKSPTYESSSCELSKMPMCIPSMSGMSEIAARDDPSALPSPASSPSPVCNPSCCSPGASSCMPAVAVPRCTSHGTVLWG